MQRFLIRRLQLFPCRLQGIANFIESTDSCSIVILNKSPDFRFYFFHGHFHCVQLIKFFFFQRCKETFHAAVVVTFAYITHALDSMHFSKFNFVLQACILASCIAVKSRFTIFSGCSAFLSFFVSPSGLLWLSYSFCYKSVKISC